MPVVTVEPDGYHVFIAPGRARPFQPRTAVPARVRRP